MSAKRYRMALEAILLIPWTDGPTMQKVARQAVVGDVESAERDDDDVPTSQTIHLTMPAPPAAPVAAGNGHSADDDEPEIDSICEHIAALDAELDAETAPPEPSGVGEGADGSAAKAGERTAAPSAPPPAPAVGALPRAAAVRRDSKLPEVIAALRDMGEATASDLADRVGIGSTHKHLQTLIDDGTAVIVGKRPRSGGQPGRGYKVYALREVMDAKVAQLGTRGKGLPRNQGGGAPARKAEVLACIHEGNGLDEQEIALQLGMHREHVAEATGALLGAGRIVLRPDGTYVDAEDAAA